MSRTFLPPWAFILFRGIIKLVIIRIIGFGTLGCLLALALLITQTAPSNVGPLGILLVFVLMYGAILGCVTLFLYYLSKVAAGLPVGSRSGRWLRGVGLRRSYYHASVMALAPVMLLALQSVGGVGIYELLLVGLFLALAWLYVSRRAV